MADDIQRLRVVVIAELQRQHDARVDTGLSYFIPSHDDLDWVTIDGNVLLTPIICALLTELRVLGKLA